MARDKAMEYSLHRCLVSMRCSTDPVLPIGNSFDEQQVGWRVTTPRGPLDECRGMGVVMRRILADEALELRCDAFFA